MSLKVIHITLDCVDLPAVSDFWASAFETELSFRTDEFAGIEFNDPTRTDWLFMKVPERKAAKNRLHTDLGTDDRPTEVARLVALGATQLTDHEQWGTQWSVLQDVEGNEFCVVQAQPESASE